MLMSLSAIAGCAISTPFQGPGYDRRQGVTLAGDDRVVVAITEAVLGGTRAQRSTFWDYVSQVEASLPGRPGFVGYALRREVIGNRAWTMTVWTDAESLDGFVQSDVHQAAIRTSMEALACASFARIDADRAEIPISWDRALESLAAANGRCD